MPTPEQRIRIARAKLRLQEQSPATTGNRFVQSAPVQFGIGAGERALEIAQTPFDLLSLLAPKDRAAVIESVPAPSPSIIESPESARQRALSAFTPSAGALASSTPPSTTGVSGVGPEQGGTPILEQILSLIPRTARQAGARFTDVATLFTPFKAAAKAKATKLAQEGAVKSAALKAEQAAKSVLEKARFDGKVSPLEYFELEQRAAQPFEAFYDEAVQAQRLRLPKDSPDSPISDIGTKVQNTIGGVKAVIGEAQERIATTPGKGVAKILTAADNEAAVLAGKSFEQFNRGAPVSPSQLQSTLGEVDNFGDAMQGLAPAINERVSVVAKNSRKVLNQLFDLARSVGVRVAGFRENYLPRFIDQDIMDDVYGQIRGVMADARMIAEQRGLNPKSAEVLAKIIAERKDAASVFNGRARQFIEHLESQAKLTGRPVTLGSLVVRAERITLNELTGIFGNLERGRKLLFPLDFYIKDPRVAIARYIERASKRIAEIKHFGVGNEKIDDLLREVGALDSSEEAYLRGIIKDWTGISNRDALQIHGLGRLAGKAQEAFVGSEFLLKIALGTATVKQVPQTLISTYVAAGGKNLVKGVADLLRRSGVHRAIRESGTLKHDIIAAETNAIGQSWIKRLGEKVGVPFMMMNRLNFYVAGSTWRRQIGEWLNTAKSALAKESDKAWAKQRLEEIGLNWESARITDDEVLKAMYRFATDSQLQRNVLRDPRWINNPKLRWLGLFQRFKLGQFNLTKDTLRREFQKNSINGLGATLRWAIGATGSGAFNVWATKQLTELVSGKPVYDETDTKWQWFLNALAEGGGGGWATDIIGSFGQHRPLSSFGRTAGFALTPVALAEALRVGEEAANIYTDIEAGRTFAETAERSFGRSVPKAGSGMRILFGNDLMTGEQKQAARDRERRMVLERYFDIIRESPQTAADLLKIYNARNPQHKIRTEDFKIFLKGRTQLPVKRFNRNLDLPRVNP